VVLDECTPPPDTPPHEDNNDDDNDNPNNNDHNEDDGHHEAEPEGQNPPNLGQLKEQQFPLFEALPRGDQNQDNCLSSFGIGEEITISYIDLAKDRTERQSMLRNWFYFDCKCDKCEKNLDSDVNYPKFLEDLHQIYSFSNFGEIFGETYLKTINRKEAYNVFNRMNACYPRIYGQYSPVLTTYLMQQLLGKWRLSRGKRTNQLLVRELFNICDTNIKVTPVMSNFLRHLDGYLWPVSLGMPSTNTGTEPLSPSPRNRL
jgi:hypothetical protein